MKYDQYVFNVALPVPIPYSDHSSGSSNLFRPQFWFQYFIQTTVLVPDMFRITVDVSIPTKLCQSQSLATEFFVMAMLLQLVTMGTYRGRYDLYLSGISIVPLFEG